MITDPDYARVFSKIRCTARMYGYACIAHGSFTRDLDLLLVPWEDKVMPAPKMMHQHILYWCQELKDSGKEPSYKPHGRIVYTLMFKEPSDPRFIDLGFIRADKYLGE